MREGLIFHARHSNSVEPIREPNWNRCKQILELRGSDRRLEKSRNRLTHDRQSVQKYNA